jgi:hypothetical protein
MAIANENKPGGKNKQGPSSSRLRRSHIVLFLADKGQNVNLSGTDVSGTSESIFEMG